ncbi:MAG: hypothetical protein ACM3XM_07680 [Mycobacterium leprae]
MEMETVFRDVELRLKALDEYHRLERMILTTQEQLRIAKERAAQAESGSSWEQKYLKEATDASTRLMTLQDALYEAEQEIRRTAYLLHVLS